MNNLKWIINKWIDSMHEDKRQALIEVEKMISENQKLRAENQQLREAINNPGSKGRLLLLARDEISALKAKVEIGEIENLAIIDMQRARIEEMEAEINRLKGGDNVE